MLIRDKNPKIILLLTGISFLASGIDCIENELITIGVLSFIVAGINILSSLFVRKFPFEIKIFLFVINAVYAGLCSYLFSVAGFDKIQYGWGLVSVIHIIAILVAFRKKAKQNKQQPENITNQQNV